MLADHIIEIADDRHEPINQAFPGTLATLAKDLRRASRYELSPGAMASAVTIHRSPVIGRLKALPICRLPARLTWFEWLGGDPTGRDQHTIVGPQRYAPIPSRIGAMVTTDESGQRGSMTFAWRHKEQGLGMNLCPLAVYFDWREMPDPLPSIRDDMAASMGMSEDDVWEQVKNIELDDASKAKGMTESMRRDVDRRYGFHWSSYAKMREMYERRHGPIDLSHPLVQACIGDLTGEPGILQAVIMLLNSRNMTESEHRPAPDRLNKQRVKRGKPPLLDYTVIRVKLSRAMTERAGSTDRAPARFHVVDGHFKIRKTGIFWWSQHSRGDPTKGTVRHQRHIVSP